MNALDILEYGHQTIMEAIADLPQQDWIIPGVSGVWSAKDVLAHLASFEHLLIDALSAAFCHLPSPTLDRWVRDPELFNETEVARRRSLSVEQVLAEYQAAHYETLNLLIRIPPKELQQIGLLPWYGDGYDVEDFIVYTFYGHKREHAAQIAAFRDHNKMSQTVPALLETLELA